MTGNTKVWRAPLAGLASLAMIATMGVAAGTAAAAPKTFTFNVDGVNLKFDKDRAQAAGVKFDSEKQVTITDGGTADVLDAADVNAAKSALADYNAVYTLTGWYDGSTAVAAEYKGAVYTDPDTKATSVTAHYGRLRNNNAKDVYTVSFANAAGETAHALNAVSTSWHLLSGDKLASWQLPTDGSATDGRLLSSWTSTTDGEKVDPTADLSGKATWSQNENQWTLLLTAGYVDSTTVTFSNTDFWSEGRTVKIDGKAQNKVVETAKGEKYGKDLPKATFEKGGQKWVAAGFATADEAKKAADKRNLFSKDTQVDGPTTLYAVSPSEYFTVTFHTDESKDESKAPDAQDVVKNGTATKPADPTKKANASQKYVFSGWTTDQAGKKSFDFSTKITANTDLYAQFKVSEVKVTFDPGYGKEPVVDTWFKDGDTFKFPAFTRDGYALTWGADALLDGKKLSINNSGDLGYIISTGEDVDKTNFIAAGKTFTATWTKADPETLTKLEAKVNENLGDDQDWYTADSYKQYKADYEDYLAKKAELANGGYTKDEYSTLISQLSAAQAKLVEVGNTNLYRVYNPNNGDHYFTTDKVEATRLVQLGWKGEGVKYHVVAARSNSYNTGVKDDEGKYIYDSVSANLGTAVWSVYNPNTGEHLLTFEGEANVLAKSGWVKEDIKFYTSQHGDAAVVRVYNPNTQGPAHVYTNGGEASVLASLGWKIDNNAKPVFTLSK
ncbi:KxYKxGKxW signal peptide [Bifidobacterium goeldii]|uniref:KxYKxGKxW signal peptide n=1 Tax=Bifidobacterium goeldii TaxID=2306975 RepID=A0A430FLW8_9BIFI|nr:InlB B-repeat-containing protein [Bifidobacterium goeldii]RSX53692.1 KxYKxGKxW signal peptide [Bifidobacterium goeldii]